MASSDPSLEPNRTAYHAYAIPREGGDDDIWGGFLNETITDLDRGIINKGRLADRPLADVQGRWYMATDQSPPTLYYDDGESWRNVLTPATYVRTSGTPNISGTFNFTNGGRELMRFPLTGGGQAALATGALTDSAGTDLGQYDVGILARAMGDSWPRAASVIFRNGGTTDFYSTSGERTMRVARDGSVAVDRGGLSVAGPISTGGEDVATDTALSAHTTDTSNPHAVTAEQAGALPTTGGTVDGDLDVTGSGSFGNGVDVDGDVVAGGELRQLYEAGNIVTGQVSGRVRSNTTAYLLIGGWNTETASVVGEIRGWRTGGSTGSAGVLEVVASSNNNATWRGSYRRQTATDSSSPNPALCHVTADGDDFFALELAVSAHHNYDTGLYFSGSVQGGALRVVNPTDDTVTVNSYIDPVGRSEVYGNAVFKGSVRIDGTATVNGGAIWHANNLDPATSSDLSAHMTDTTNPHNVTAAQADALSTGGGTVTGNVTVQGETSAETVTANGSINIPVYDGSDPTEGNLWIREDLA